MQPRLVLFACLFVCAGCCAQQYPFVYYTPNEGLVNSRVRNVKQDSRGRLYFITYGGLSVYDGVKFINYQQKEGLANELVNDVVEAGPDSFLVATNTQKLNTLVRGKIGVYRTEDNFYPLVNRFLKSDAGNWYAAADDGLFLLTHKRFVRLSLIDKNGRDVGQYLDQMVQWKNFILLLPWNSQHQQNIILYDTKNQRLADVYIGMDIFAIQKDYSENIWITTENGIRVLNLEKLQAGKIEITDPPSKYAWLKNIRGMLTFFDAENNIWLFGNNELRKISPQLQMETISTGRNLKGGSLLNMFEDKEGIIWIASDGNGAIKIKGTDFQFMNEVNNHTLMATTLYQQADTTWLFNTIDNSFYRIYQKKVEAYPFEQKKINPGSLYIFQNKLYTADDMEMYCITDITNPASFKRPKIILTKGSKEPSIGGGIVDHFGSIIQNIKINDSSYYITVISNDKIIFKYPLKFSTDQLAIDKAGNIWLATRQNHLLAFSAHPEQPSQYLQLEKDFFTELPVVSPRSITIDTNSNVWLGTRYDGIVRIELDKFNIKSVLQFNTANGLTDNFVYTLSCDKSNNIWAGTQSGLDKIFFKEGKYIINNISRSNNFFQSIRKIIVNDDNTVWALTNEGTIIRIIPFNRTLPSPPPVLITLVKINDKLNADSSYRFTYHQNNFLFSVAAPSFTDEKSIRYSYRLTGSGNDNWSDPSTNADFNFINLSPGNYILEVKAEFPAAMYPPQFSHFAFAILPPWWQTWWFRLLALAIAIVLAAYFIKSYVRRKLLRQRLLLEKQQAIEKERTRIATDMHDDLGAGLSRINFLSETIGIKKQQHLPIEEDIGKIREYSHEMIDKMGEIVWALNEKNDSLSDLLSYTRSYAVEYLSENGIQYIVEMPEHLPGQFVSGEFRQNIFLSVKEILHNIVKHAQANSVKLVVSVGKNLFIQISDDGIGFDRKNIKPFSNGLYNIEKRMAEIGGKVEIENDEGTRIRLTAPLAS